MAIIYLHIGLHKTATTSIQKCLARSANSLATNKVLIPETGQAIGSGHQLAWCFLPRCPAWYPLSQLPAEGLYNQLNTEIIRTGAEKVIISSEDFSLIDKDDSNNPQNIKKIKKYLEKHETRIIVYLRSQVDYLASFYNQTHKAFDSRFSDKSIKGLCHDLQGILDYEVLLDRWASVFGKENVEVGIYEESRLGKGIVSDFADKCRITLDNSEQKSSNTGLDDDTLAYKILINEYSFDEHANVFLANPLSAISTGKYNLPFSQEYTHELINKYKASNVNVINKYLGHKESSEYSGYLSGHTIKNTVSPDLTWQKANQITGALIGETLKEISVLEDRSYERFFHMSARQGEMDKNLGLISDKQTLMAIQLAKGFDKINDQGEIYKQQLNHLVLNVFAKAASSVSFAEKLSALFRNDARVIEKSGVFDKEYYLAVYPDIKASATDPIKHYLKYGASEGRNPSATFNTVAYLSENLDVAFKGINPLVHYVLYGRCIVGTKRTAGILQADVDAENTSNQKEPSNRLRVVVIEHDIPKYDTNAGARHTFQYIKLLVNMGVKITLLPFIAAEGDTSVEEKALLDLGVNVLKHDSTDPDSWSGEHWKKWLYDNQDGIDLMIIHRPHVAEVYMDYCKNVLYKPAWYMCHDLYFLRMGRQAIVEKNENLLVQQAEMMAKERTYFEMADVSFTPSKKDEEYLSLNFNINNVVTLPLYIYDHIDDTPRNIPANKNIIFVGSFTHAPNIDGITWFINEVWPAVLNKEPGTVLNIVGKSPPEKLAGGTTKNLLLHGYVTDQQLEKLYRESRAMIVPLRYGAGVKGKVVEAMCSGLPFISTSCGLEGVLGLEKYIFPQDAASGFADEIVRILNLSEREDERLSKSLKEAARDQFLTEIAGNLLRPYLNREFYT